VQVANGYRASKLRGVTVSNPQNQKIGDLDDLIVGKDRVLFAIVQVGGLLGIGSHLIAVPYSSLQINEDGTRIVLPGATREQVRHALCGPQHINGAPHAMAPTHMRLPRLRRLDAPVPMSLRRLRKSALS
jgi:PRC-barrel domain